MIPIIKFKLEIAVHRIRARIKHTQSKSIGSKSIRSKSIGQQTVATEQRGAWIMKRIKRNSDLQLATMLLIGFVTKQRNRSVTEYLEEGSSTDVDARSVRGPRGGGGGGSQPLDRRCDRPA